MSEIPSGQVTFLLSDIEGSTRLAQKFPKTVQRAIDEHNEIFRKCVSEFGGYIFDNSGDSFASAFSSTASAIECSVKIQMMLLQHEWSDAVIKIRIGIHSGKAEWSGSRYMGYFTIARSARIMSSAYGGQILLSEEAFTNVCEEPAFSNSFRDMGERRLKDLIQPVRLYQVNRPGLESDFPPLKTLDARPNNLPVQLTSFIGRRAEMDVIRENLNDTHLLTITGTGGSGKTRLALQIAADVIDDFPDGVWLVELASVSTMEQLEGAVVKTFDITEVQSINNLQVITDYLKNKELLIVLDNCEHIVEEAAKFVHELLRRCSGVKIIATSREALKCEGEQTHIVCSLEIPEASRYESTEELTQFEAVRLFIERALSVNREFRVTNANAPHLAQICIQLEGIPLAIELAAARTRALSVEQICSRLHDRFRLLSGGRRTADPRQQTLRSMIDWSYELLAEKEKKLWNRLSIFTSGWNLEAAEKICSDGELECQEIIDLLTSLIEKSILIFDESANRYRMLETLKQYGHEKLCAENEDLEMFSRHLRYYTDIAPDSGNKLRSSDSNIILEMLDREKGNIDSALSRSVQYGLIKEGIDLANHVSYYWQLGGYYSEALSWFRTFYEISPEKKSKEYFRVLSQLGNFERLRGNLESSREYLIQCLSQSRESGMDDLVSDTLNRLGITEYDFGRYDEARKHHLENKKLFEQRGDKLGLSKTLNNLGNVYANLGDLSAAVEMFSESLHLRRELNDNIGAAITLNNIGILAYERGDYEDAIQKIEESVNIRRGHGDKSGVAISLENLGNVYYNMGEYGKALEFYDECLSIFEEHGERTGIADIYYNLGKVEVAKGNSVKAEELFLMSLEMGKETNSNATIAEALYGMGRVLFNKGDYQNSLSNYRESLAIYFRLSNKKDIDLNLIRIAEVLSKIEDVESSALLLGFVNEHYIKGIKIKLPYADQSAYDETLKRVIEEMGHDLAGDTMKEGSRLNMNDVHNIAMDLR